ncbi:OLC1v1013196C1 [Oldenlandia corymbosa var. corymbosa]|uniref:OLC1v1013196C1 n=1 Tax=Oldenlandia corymbosa var. corymbosa TaxID=529605 RepID=A0AAV1DXQ0_OLDCO|nr:OLC1v1013196C1 [Oldenlandia corymbosa var. corymbosa]
MLWDKKMMFEMAHASKGYSRQDLTAMFLDSLRRVAAMRIGRPPKWGLLRPNWSRPIPEKWYHILKAFEKVDKELCPCSSNTGGFVHDMTMNYISRCDLSY